MRRRTLLTALALLPLAAPARAREGGGPSAPGVVRIRAIMVPVIVEDRVERYAPYDVTLELTAAGKVPAVQAMLPRLQEAATTVVYEAVAKSWIVRGNIANATALRRRMEEELAHHAGADTIARVLIAPAARSNF